MKKFPAFAAFACFALPATAFAQEGGSMFSASASAEASEEGASADTSAAAEAEETAEAPEPAPAPATTTTAAPALAAADLAPPGGTDHSRFVGTFAIGYLGFREIGPVNWGGTPNGVPVVAPVIGMRYWLDSFMGIDAGLGFATSGDSTETSATGTPTVTTDTPGPLVFILHGGVPLALADSQHFVFQIVPELNIGYGTVSFEPGPGTETTNSAFHVDIGARAGAEIHFGFVGIPQLSLQAGVGLRFAMTSSTTETVAGGNTTTVNQSRTAISTTVGDNPWNIFAANVSALYYFDR